MSLWTKLTERRAKRECGFWGTARAIAEGKRPPSVEAVEATLAETGKTADELKAAAETVGRRIELADKLKREAEIEPRRAELNQAIRDADERLRSAQQAHAEAVGPLRTELGTLNDQARECRQARGELIRDCPYAEITARLTDATARHSAAVERRAECERRLSRNVDSGQTERANALRADLSAIQTDIGAIEAELRDLNAEAARP
jgi:chromosome segregation ATPase